MEPNILNVNYNILQIGGQVMCTVKYVDDLVLLAKEEMVLYGMLVGVKDTVE